MRSLTILQLNDLHGYLTPHPELFRLAPNDRFRSGGGVARIATLFQSIRREVDGALIALDNGDTFHGTMPAVCTEGEALIGPMSALGLDGMTAHWEFAYGIERLKAIADRLPYPLLAANCQDDTGASPFPPFRIIERGGVTVGVIGLAAVIAGHLLPVADRDRIRLTLGDAALRTHIQFLKREHRVDVIVVLSHLGFPQDCKLAAVVPGIDVLLSGHTHNRLQQPAVVNGTLIIQSGAHGSFVGRLDLEVSPAGIVGWRHALLPVDDATAPDAAMAHIVDHANGAFAGASAHVVGTTRTALDRYAMLESTMDNLLLDAIANAADRPIALSNGWRYGAPIPPGPLTESDLWNIVPTNPPVSVAAITGDELRRLFEENLEATFACDPWQQRGGYLKRGRGIQLAVKLENARGHRIQEFRVDGDRLRRDAIYSVAFLGEQAIPADYGRDRRSLGMHAVDALRQHLHRHDSVSADLRGAVVVV